MCTKARSQDQQRVQLERLGWKCLGSTVQREQGQGICQKGELPSTLGLVQKRPLSLVPNPSRWWRQGESEQHTREPDRGPIPTRARGSLKAAEDRSFALEMN